MKKLYIIITVIVSEFAFSQVIIGDDVGTVPALEKSSVLLEFSKEQHKGIILPYVRTLPSGVNVTEGSIVLDATDATKAKVKYYNGSWVDLSSGNEANINIAMTKQPSGITEDPSAKVVIGANTSLAQGVLILESNTKAMVMPIVNNTDEIPDPAPGMLVYINKTGAKRLAVYNGAVWTYWKP